MCCNAFYFNIVYLRVKSGSSFYLSEKFNAVLLSARYLFPFSCRELLSVDCITKCNVNKT